MKTKILASLKQAYSHLGLGDAILSSQADSLAATGLVNDENLGAIVEALKPFLESVQKGNDKRANDAVENATKALKKEVETLKKELEDKVVPPVEPKKVEPKQQPDEPKKEPSEEIPAWFSKFLESNALAEETRKSDLKKLTEEFGKLKKDYDGARVEAARKARENFILEKAKELGVPQYRIEEGFAFAEDADESAITASLTTIANNIKANMLPSDKRFRMGDDTPSKEEVSNIAKALVR